MVDTKEIEDKALNYLKSFIEDSTRISQYLDDNDKEPSWDGHLYLYSGEGKCKKHFLGRVPVQVKGTEVERFQIKKWKFRLEKADLKAYLNEPTFFIVCQIKKGSKERKLFYRELLPDTVKTLLKDMGKKESRMTVFHPLTDDVKEFEDQLTVFMRNSVKMLSFTDSKPMTMNDVVARGIKDFTFVAPEGMADRFQFLKYLSTHPVHLYANLSEEMNIDFPISGGPMTVSYVGDEKQDVMVGGRIFFHEFAYEVKEGRLLITIGGFFEINLPMDEKDKEKATVKFSPKAKFLDESIHETEFLVALSDNEELCIGNHSFSVVVKEKGNVEELREKICRWKELKAVLDKLHVCKPFDLTKITGDQSNLINILIETIGKGHSVKLQKQEARLLIFEISNLNLLLWCSENQNGEYTLGDFFDGSCKISYLYCGTERIEVSSFSFLQNENLWQIIDNINYDELIPFAEKAVERSVHCFELLNLDVLAMISAADALENKDVDKRLQILNECARLNDWLYSHEPKKERILFHYCNRMQIVKRQRTFTEDEVAELGQYLEDNSTPDIIKTVMCLLLENRVRFDSYFSKLSETERESLQSFPIWKFKDF